MLGSSLSCEFRIDEVNNSVVCFTVVLEQMESIQFKLFWWADRGRDDGAHSFGFSFINSVDSIAISTIIFTCGDFFMQKDFCTEFILAQLCVTFKALIQTIFNKRLKRGGRGGATRLSAFSDHGIPEASTGRLLCYDVRQFVCTNAQSDEAMLVSDRLYNI